MVEAVEKAKVLLEMQPLEVPVDQVVVEEEMAQVP